MGLLDRIKRLWRGTSSVPALSPAGPSQQAITRYIRAVVNGMLEAKSLRPQDLLPDSYAGKPVFTDYSAATVITNSLKASVIVYACTTLVARTVASIPWQVFDGDELAPPDHPLSRLVAKPNTDWTWNLLTQHLMYSLQLWGEAFESKIRSRALGTSALYPTRRGTDGGLPAELWILSPDTVAVLRGSEDNLVQKYQGIRNGRRIDVAPEDMMHHMYPNPGNYYRGLSPLEAGQRDAETDKSAAEWQKYSIDNRAIPAGIVKSKEDYFGSDQWDEFQDHIDTAWAGAANARKVIKMGADIDWVALSQTMVDMDFQEGRARTGGNICTDFGVPPEMIGLREAKYRNYETAERVFWTQTVLPNVEGLRDTYNMQLAPEFGPNVRLVPDLSSVEALLRMFGERWDVAQKMIETGLPVSTASALMSLGIPEYPGQQFTAEARETINTLWSKGVPMSVISEMLDLDIPDYLGRDVGFVPATVMPVDMVVAGGSTDEE